MNEVRRVIRMAIFRVVVIVGIGVLVIMIYLIYIFLDFYLWW